MDRKGFLRSAAADRTVSIDTTVEVSHHRLKLFPCEQMQRRRCRLKVFVAAIRDLNEAATKTGCQRLRLVGVRMVGGYLLWAHRPGDVRGMQIHRLRAGFATTLPQVHVGR